MNVAGILLVLHLAVPAGGGDGHLLAGARAFREGRYDEALVEFRVAQELGAPDASGYAAAALVKLGRAEEALEAFGGEDAPGRDALLDYYRALACYEARLYQCADRLLAGVGERSGPRIGEQAAKMRAGIAAELAPEPGHGAIDWYLAVGQARLDAARPLLARAYAREALQLSERRRDGYRRSDAAGLLARAEKAATARGGR